MCKCSDYGVVPCFHWSPWLSCAELSHCLPWLLSSPTQRIPQACPSFSLMSLQCIVYFLEPDSRRVSMAVTSVIMACLRPATPPHFSLSNAQPTKVIFPGIAHSPPLLPLPHSRSHPSPVPCPFGSSTVAQSGHARKVGLGSYMLRSMRAE